MVKYFDDGLAVGGRVPSLGAIVHGDTPGLPHTNLLPWLPPNQPHRYTTKQHLNQLHINIFTSTAVDSIPPYWHQTGNILFHMLSQLSSLCFSIPLNPTKAYQPASESLLDPHFDLHPQLKCKRENCPCASSARVSSYDVFLHTLWMYSGFCDHKCFENGCNCICASLPVYFCTSCKIIWLR